MSNQSVRMRQLVDWRAALLSGLVSGAVFLLLNILLVPALLGGNAWIVLRYIASILLGTGVLPPPATFDPLVLIVGILVLFAMSILFAAILAIIIHRWGLLVGIGVGALYGLAVYAINYYTLTLFFPWLFVMNSWVIALCHVIYGAVAGGVYEALEVEVFVPMESAEA